jgi:uncharacterized membrane protein
MNKGRLEAFSDGVFAIIITIMVLDLTVPSGPSLEACTSKRGNLGPRCSFIVGCANYFPAQRS